MSEARDEWRAGRWLIFISMLGAGTAVWYQGATGIVMKPLVQEYGWSRSQVTSAHFIVGMMSVALAWIVGSVIDKIGSRRIVIIGAALNVLGLLLISATGPGIWTWYAAWVVYGLCHQFIHPVVFVTPVTKIFRKHRGLALAVVLSGAGLALAFIPYVATLLNNAYGWRGVYIGLAAGFLVLVLPLLWFGFQDPVPVETIAKARQVGLSLPQALRTSRIYRMAIPALLVAGSNGLMLVHFVPMTTDRGLDPVSAAVAVGLFGPCNTIGRLGMGWLIDRLHAPYISAVAALLPLIYVALYFNFDGSFASAVVMGIALGLASGAESDAVAYMVSRFFGLRHYGAIFGVVFGCHSAAFACGPLLGGLFFDHFGGYDQVMLLIAFALCVASLLFATLGRYPDLEAESETAAVPPVLTAPIQEAL